MRAYSYGDLYNYGEMSICVLTGRGSEAGLHFQNCGPDHSLCYLCMDKMTIVWGTDVGGHSPYG
jgi:hypothetical protein